MKVGPFVRTLLAGHPRTRLAALRAGGRAIDVAMTGAALRTGILADLVEAPRTAAQVADLHGWVDVALAEAFLKVLASAGLLREDDGRWVATKAGRRVAGDAVAAAVYDAFSGYHTELYRQIEQQLTGGQRRTDIELDGDLIARLSRFMDEFVLAALDDVVSDDAPSRVLDVGCGSASHLVHLLRGLPGSEGVGVESDPSAASMAERAVTSAGLGSRSCIVESDVLTYLSGHPHDRFDLILAANLIYYVPLSERVAFLRALGERLNPGGRLVIVTMALTNDSFSRHFDLLLRAHAGGRELPDMAVLSGQLVDAGMEPGEPKRIAPGQPLTALEARRC